MKSRGEPVGGNRSTETERRVVLPNGSVRLERRDLLGRLRRIDEPDGSRLALRYDPEGRLISVLASSGERVDFEYTSTELRALTARSACVLGLSPAGVPTEQTLRVDDHTWSLACQRDQHGAIRAVCYPDAARFTSANELCHFEVLRDGARVRFSSGAETLESFSNGRLGAVVIGGRQFGIDYDGAGRITALAGSSVTYDAEGRLARFGEREYGYDAEGRLVRAGEHSFEYWGPLVKRAGAVRFEYDAIGRRSARHDANGTTRYAYNLFGQLSRVDLPDHRGIEYVYDGFGQLVARVLDGVPTYYIPGFDGRRLAQASANGRVERSYVYSGLQCVLCVDGAPPGPVLHTYHRFSGGRLLAIGDAEGALSFQPLSDPYGVDSTDHDGVPGFAGLFPEPLTGLLLAGSRWYDPSVAAFIAPDAWFGDRPSHELPRELRRAFEAMPGGTPRSITPVGAYAWCEYDPVNRIDPNGHNWLGVIWSILSSVTWGWHFNSLALQMESAAIVWELLQLVSGRFAWDNANWWKYSIFNMPAPVGSYRQMTGALLLNGLWRAVIPQDTLWVSGNVIWSRPGDWEQLTDERARELIVTTAAPALLASTAPAAATGAFLVRNPRARATGTSNAAGDVIEAMSWTPADATTIDAGFERRDTIAVGLAGAPSDVIRSVRLSEPTSITLDAPLPQALRNANVVVTRLEASKLWVEHGGHRIATEIAYARGTTVHLTQNVEVDDFPSGSGLTYHIREAIPARVRATETVTVPADRNIVRFAEDQRNSGWQDAVALRIRRGNDLLVRRVTGVLRTRDVLIEPPIDVSRGAWVGLEVVGLVRATALVSDQNAQGEGPAERTRVPLSDLATQARTAGTPLARSDGLEISTASASAVRLIRAFRQSVTVDEVSPALRGVNDATVDLLTVDTSRRERGTLGANPREITLDAGTTTRLHSGALVRLRPATADGAPAFSRVEATSSTTLTLSEDPAAISANTAVEIAPLTTVRSLTGQVSAAGDQLLLPSEDATTLAADTLLHVHSGGDPGVVRVARASVLLAELDSALPAELAAGLTLRHLVAAPALRQTRATIPDLFQAFSSTQPIPASPGSLLHIVAGGRDTLAVVASVDGTRVVLDQAVPSGGASSADIKRMELTGVVGSGRFAAGTVLVPSEPDLELSRLESFQQHELRHCWQAAIWGPFFLSMPVPFLFKLGFSFSPIAESASKILRWIPFGMSFIDSLLAGAVWAVDGAESATEVQGVVGPDTSTVVVDAGEPADALARFEPGANINVIGSRTALNFVETLDTATRRITLRYPLDPAADFNAAAIGDTVRLSASRFDQIRRAVNVFFELNLHELWAEQIPATWARTLAQFINKENWLPGLGFYLLPYLIAKGDRNRVPFEQDASFETGFLYNNIVVAEPNEIFAGQFARIFAFNEIRTSSLSAEGRTVSALQVALPSSTDPLTPAPLQSRTAEQIADHVDGAVLEPSTRSVTFRESRIIPMKERVENVVGAFFSASHPGTYTLRTTDLPPEPVRWGPTPKFLRQNTVRVKPLEVTLNPSGAEVFEADSVELTIRGAPSAAYFLDSAPAPAAGGVFSGWRWHVPVLPSGAGAPDTLNVTLRVLQRHPPDAPIFRGKGQLGAPALRPDELTTLCHEHPITVRRLPVPQDLACCAGDHFEFEVPFAPASYRVTSARPAGASTDATLTWSSTRPCKVTFHAPNAVNDISPVDVTLVFGAAPGTRKEMPLTLRVHPRRPIKIHPAIGVARVGNHPTEFFLGPEIPGRPVNDAHTQSGVLAPGFTFKDGGRIKRQGARFRVFEYLPDGTTRELVPGSNGVREIRWTVHLANKKAAWFSFSGTTGERGYPTGHVKRNPHISADAERLQQLVIDFGPRSIKRGDTPIPVDSASVPQGYRSKGPGPLRAGVTIQKLGDLRVDAEGRLIVLGGAGLSGTSSAATAALDPNPVTAENDGWSNNDGWFDDISDGPVRATVVFDDGLTCDVEGAWVLVAPPDFAPEIPNVINLHDAIFDVAVRHFRIKPQLFDGSDPGSRGGFKSSYRPSFAAEILPLMLAAKLQGHVNAFAGSFHDDLVDPARTDAERASDFGRMNDPWSPNQNDSSGTSGARMPYLRGDDDLPTLATITRTQYFLVEQWKNGLADFAPVAPQTTITPEGLDRAALENCIGGAFYPGIEAGWMIREPKIYSAPFRLKHRTPGADLSLGYGAVSGGKIIPEDVSGLGLEAGDLTKRMALPWQADFHDCQEGGESVPWWPGQRPDDVPVGSPATSAVWTAGIADNRVAMVRNWHQLGYVVNRGTTAAPSFVEVERNVSR